MLTDAHKEFIMYIRRKMLVHNNSPVYINSLEKQTLEVGIDSASDIVDRWALPANNLAFVSNNFCIVVNKIDAESFNYMFMLGGEEYALVNSYVSRQYGKVELTGDVNNPFVYSINVRATKKKKGAKAFAAAKNITSMDRGEVVRRDVLSTSLWALFMYFGMTIIDHEYVDVEDQAEIHYSKSDSKPPVKVRYIKKVLKRYINGSKTERGPVTTGWDVQGKYRLYKHPRYKNVRGQKLWVRGYHVGPPTDNRSIEYRRKESEV